MTTWHRVNRESPCAICGRPDWCTVAADGAACCMRTPSDTQAANGGNMIAQSSNKSVSSPTPDVDLDPLWSSRRVRAFVDVAERTFRRWLAAGKFPPADVRIGHREGRQALRWKRSTVESWVSRGGTQE